eukprot:IDg19283t1
MACTIFACSWCKDADKCMCSKDHIAISAYCNVQIYLCSMLLSRFLALLAPIVWSPFDLTLLSVVYRYGWFSPYSISLVAYQRCAGTSSALILNSSTSTVQVALQGTLSPVFIRSISGRFDLRAAVRYSPQLHSKRRAATYGCQCAPQRQSHTPNRAANCATGISDR